MIRLGARVRDLLSGITGIAVGRTEWLYGCARIAIESIELKKDGKPSDSIWLDEQRVEETESDGNENPFVYCPFDVVTPVSCDVVLGSRVKDKLTGFEGIASSKTVWSSGNVLIGIEPTTLYEGKPIQAHSFEAQRVEILEVKKPPVSKDNSAVSGGPQNDPAIP